MFARTRDQRDYTSLDKLYAIRIKRDSDSHRWATGNGREPILTMPAPQLPASAERIPAARLVRGS